MKSVWRRMVLEAYFKASVVIANGLMKLGSWKMDLDRNNCFRLSKDACASVIQSQQWSFLIRSRRGWAMVE